MGLRFKSEAEARAHLGKRVPDDPPLDLRPAPIKRKMTRPEMLYAQILDMEVRAGTIKRWAYEAITLKLAPRLRYTPDFDLWLPDGTLAFDEVKGAHIYEDSWVKLKAAAALFPEHRFRLAQLTSSSWRFKEIPAR